MSAPDLTPQRVTLVHNCNDCGALYGFNDPNATHECTPLVPRPAPDLTAHDEAVATAAQAVDELMAYDGPTESIALAVLIAAAEARGYARAKMEGQP